MLAVSAALTMMQCWEDMEFFTITTWRSFLDRLPRRKCYSILKGNWLTGVFCISALFESQTEVEEKVRVIWVKENTAWYITSWLADSIVFKYIISLWTSKIYEYCEDYLLTLHRRHHPLWLVWFVNNVWYMATSIFWIKKLVGAWGAPELELLASNFPMYVQ